jgi:hypothetical protein
VRITDLLQREPFGDIAERTVAHYLSSRYQVEARVSWQQGRAPRQAEGQLWRCLPDLNVLFAPDVRPETFEVVRREFGYTPVRWRRLPQKILVDWLTIPAVAHRMARFTLAISPALDDAAHLLWLGGNNRLRLVDMARQRVVFVLKQGFDPRTMQREIAVRKDAGGLPIPPIDQVAEDGTWFEGPLIEGHPVNRLRDPDTIRRLTDESLRVLSQWSARTREGEPADAYVARTANQVRHWVGIGKAWSPLARQRVENWLNCIQDIVQRLSATAGATLVTAVGHGDFQPGNILYDGEQIWFTDWEYSERRQWEYDTLTFWLGSRFATGLAARIAEMLERPECVQSQPMVAEWLNWSRLSVEHRKLILVVFLLEELAWRTQENANPYFHQLDAGWRAYTAELEAALGRVTG